MADILNRLFQIHPDYRQSDNNQTVIETTPCSKLSGKRTVAIVGSTSLELYWGITQPTKHGKWSALRLRRISLKSYVSAVFLFSLSPFWFNCICIVLWTSYFIYLVCSWWCTKMFCCSQFTEFKLLQSINELVFAN